MAHQRSLPIRRAAPLPWVRWAVVAFALLGLGVLLLALWNSARPLAPVPATTASLANDSLLLLLAPVIAVAAAIERFWEAIFTLFERFARSTGRVVGLSSATVGWVYNEVDRAEEAVTILQGRLRTQDPASPEYQQNWRAFQQAEQHLLDAQSRIDELFKNSDYIALKRAFTLLGSLIIGVVIALITGLRIFGPAGFPLNDLLDRFLTGLLIGAGPGPLHTFIGTLQELRNTLGGLANLAQGNALRRLNEAARAPVGPPPAATTPASLLGGHAQSPATDDQRLDLSEQRAMQRLLNLRRQP